MLFQSYLERTGLEPLEAEEVNELTKTAQRAKSWIRRQTVYRAAGFKKVAKAEAGIELIKEVLIVISDNEESIMADEVELLSYTERVKLLLVKAACAIDAHQYQRELLGYPYFSDRTSSDSMLWRFLIDKILEDKEKVEILKNQYLKSKRISENRGWFQKLQN